MSINHTPGPWTVYDDGPDGSDVIMAHDEAAGENIDIASMSTDAPESERNANARLIAAAPELVEALRGALEYLEANPDEFSLPRRDRCRAALERAGVSE